MSHVQILYISQAALLIFVVGIIIYFVQQESAVPSSAETSAQEMVDSGDSTIAEEPTAGRGERSSAGEVNQDEHYLESLPTYDSILSQLEVYGAERQEYIVAGEEVPEELEATIQALEAELDRIFNSL